MLAVSLAETLGLVRVEWRLAVTRRVSAVHEAKAKQRHGPEKRTDQIDRRKANSGNDGSDPTLNAESELHLRMRMWTVRALGVSPGSQDPPGARREA